MVLNLSRRHFYRLRNSAAFRNSKSPQFQFLRFQRRVPPGRRFQQANSPRQSPRQTYRQSPRQTYRQSPRQTYRQSPRQTYNQSPRVKNVQNSNKFQKSRTSNRPKNANIHTGLPVIRGTFPAQFELHGPYASIPLELSSSSSPPCPQIFKPAYVLSIRPERMQEFVRRMGPWSTYCKRGKCVIGSTLDKKQLLRSNVINSAGSKLKLGEIGCWLSHLNAWQCIDAAPYDHGTIFEDDAGFTHSTQISSRVQEAMAELDRTGTHWDVLYWCVLPFPHVSAGLRDCHLKHWFIAPPNQCFGCIAYTIKKSVAHMWISRAKPIHNPVDVWVSESFNRLKVFCIKPILGFMVYSFSDTDDSMNPGYLRYLK